MSATVDGPIGLFDSGVGGLTVARALADRLPGERLLYFGDTAHLPYGDKSPEAIRGYSLAIAQHLVDLGAKAIVVACNSASSVAYEALVAAMSVPVFNVIDPVVAEVARLGVDRVGIWGTKATIKSGVFPAKLKASAPGATVRAWATPLLVPVIEENILQGPILDAVIDGYARPTEAEDVDALVLACTHYPIVAAQIGQRLGQIGGVKRNLAQQLPATGRTVQQADRVISEVEGESWFHVTGLAQEEGLREHSPE